jgi:DNA-binding transcriptional ArsR family regulator
LSALDTHVPNGELPVMSVKELAQHLGEPQTKLYRHVKQLEAAGLIEVAATRMVSGILEQRYRARQRDLRLSAALFRRHADETEAAIRSAFDAFLRGLFDRARKEDWPSEGPDKPVMLLVEERVSLEAAERIRARVAEVTREISEAEAGDEPVHVAIAFYRPAT